MHFSALYVCISHPGSHCGDIAGVGTTRAIPMVLKNTDVQR